MDFGIRGSAGCGIASGWANVRASDWMLLALLRNTTFVGGIAVITWGASGPGFRGFGVERLGVCLALFDVVNGVPGVADG